MVMDVLTWELQDWIGLNTSPNNSSKDPHYVEDCQNVDFDERKLIIKRRGTQPIVISHNASPDAVIPDAVYDECQIEIIRYWPPTEIPDGKHISNYNNELYILKDTYNAGAVFVYNQAGTLDRSFDTTTINTNPSCMQCIAVGPDYVYVGASSNASGPVIEAHIARFTLSGTFVGTFVVYPTETFGYNPRGMCFIDGYLYVASNYGLHKYDSVGTLVWEIAYRGVHDDAHPSYFFTPYALTSDGTYVYVTDYAYNNILKYACSDGAFVSHTSVMVPSTPTGIAWRDTYLFVPTATGVRIFDRDTLELICTPVFGDPFQFYDYALSNITYDGSHFWCLGQSSVHTNPLIIKFLVHVTGEPII